VEKKVSIQIFTEKSFFSRNGKLFSFWFAFLKFYTEHYNVTSVWDNCSDTFLIGYP